MTTEVRIVEVGPRDGLQNEKARVSTDDKVRFVDLLSDAGFGWIEVTSFVHPNAVPQMADAEDVLRRIHKRPGTRYVALVPNPRGLARALQAELKDIALFVAATESFSRANINRSIAQSLEDSRAVIDGAQGAPVRAYIRARDVMLSLKPPQEISALNVLAGKVAEIANTAGGAQADVHLDCGGAHLLARLTAKSVQRLALEPGRPVYAVIKSVSFERN